MKTNQQQTQTPRIALVLLLFFTSGVLALTYEVVWTRMMVSVFGSTAVAVGTVLAAFMAGLAIGGWQIGKFADKSRHCLRLYAWLELSIALVALASHLVLSQIGPAHTVIYELVSSSAASFGFVRFVLAFALVMLPTLLMGATLPVLSRFLLGRTNTVGINLSTLYAVNTLGAVVGVLITGFFLIGRYGVHVPVYGAVMGNLMVGVIAWIASFRIPATLSGKLSAPKDLDEVVASKIGPPGPVTTRIILLGLGLSGFTSFAYEIYWTRSLVFVLGNSTYALTTMLSSFLTGIALGGYLIRFLLRRSVDRCVIFGWVQVLLGTFSALALPLLFLVSDTRSLNQYLVDTAGQIFPLVFAGFGVAFLVMLIPAMLIGATFPLVGQICVKDPQHAGASVGRVYAVNTFGNVLGALAPGFILLNWLGIQKGILAMAALNAGLGFVILFLRLTPRSRHPAWRLVLPTLLVLSAFTMSRAPLDFQFPSEGETSNQQTLFYREGPSATTKVFWDPAKQEKHMSVDGIVIGGTGMVEFKQLLLAHLPKLLLQDVATELSIGVGSGILLGESFRHPRVENITGVEIEPGVVEGADWFSEENHRVLQHPGLEIVNDDIGNFLRTTSKTYQVITADEKTADEYASNGFSYSLEYYELLNRHLAPGGLVAQWIPTTLPPEQYQMILRTFSDSFAHVQLWYFLPARKRGPFNSILIGSKQAIPISINHMSRQFAENHQAYQSLAPYGLSSAEAVVPHFVADEKHIREAVSTAVVNSLDYPRYEFYYPWDYKTEEQNKFVSNHQFIIELKRKAYAGYLAALVADSPESARLGLTLTAEDIFLVGFEKFLLGLSLTETYRIFDYVLSLAPWNESLRSRIYVIYAHIAASGGSPMERTQRMKRADSLYEEAPGP